MDMEAGMAIGTAIGAGVSVLVTRLAKLLSEKTKDPNSLRPNKPSPVPQLRVEDELRIKQIHEVICRKDEETGAWILTQEARRMRRALEEVVYLLTPEEERHKLRRGSISDAE